MKDEVEFYEMMYRVLCCHCGRKTEDHHLGLIYGPECCTVWDWLAAVWQEMMMVHAMWFWLLYNTSIPLRPLRSQYASRYAMLTKYGFLIPLASHCLSLR